MSHYLPLKILPIYNIKTIKSDILLVNAEGEKPPLVLRCLISFFNRPLSKLGAVREVRGETERRTGVYTLVHEDSSTVSTKQFSRTVEFQKRSNDSSTTPVKSSALITEWGLFSQDLKLTQLGFFIQHFLCGSP